MNQPLTCSIQLPPQGNPGALRAVASAWATAGQDLDLQAERIVRAGADTSVTWAGAGGDAFRRSADDVATTVRGLGTSATEVAGELNTLAQTIEDAQTAYRNRLQHLARHHTGTPWAAIISTIGLIAVQFLPGVGEAADAADAAAADAGGAVDAGTASDVTAADQAALVDATDVVGAASRLLKSPAG